MMRNPRLVSAATIIGCWKLPLPFHLWRKLIAPCNAHGWATVCVFTKSITKIPSATGFSALSLLVKIPPCSGLGLIVTGDAVTSSKLAMRWSSPFSRIWKSSFFSPRTTLPEPSFTITGTVTISVVEEITSSLDCADNIPAITRTIPTSNLLRVIHSPQDLRQGQTCYGKTAHPKNFWCETCFFGIKPAATPVSSQSPKKSRAGFDSGICCVLICHYTERGGGPEYL